MKAIPLWSRVRSQASFRLRAGSRPASNTGQPRSLRILTPSLSQVQERLTLENRLRGVAAVKNMCIAIDHELEELSIQFDDVRAKRARLGDETVSSEDAATLAAFRGSFQQQLESYGLRSVAPTEVTIDERTMLPVNDGFELSFDMALGISASDAIRTKWAYHTAIFETASTNTRGHHLGLVVLDEPRQQETGRQSLAAFLERLNADRGLGQVIYATSEEPETLTELLRGTAHAYLLAGGPHLLVRDPE